MRTINLDQNDNADITKFPTLYKQTTTGKIQQWQVQVFGNGVTSTYGQVDGKLQETTDIVKSGKNIGKANETTPEEQAGLKAQQLFDKKVKEGYVTDITLAQQNANNLEGVEPMLAFDAEKKKKYMTFPGTGQPKLDGFRCIAVIQNGKCQLYTRTQKPINTLPHIVQELEQVFGTAKSIVLDGELYNHELKNDFEKICSYIKRDEVHENHEIIQYHIYDHVSEGTHHQRYSMVNAALNIRMVPCMFLKTVETVTVNSEQELEAFFHKCLADGYEGAMYRHPEMEYEHKRSAGLLKIKVFEDAEFEVTGVQEGTGKLMGQAGAILVKDSDGKEFKAKLKSLTDSNGKRVESKEDYQARCADWLVNIENYIGKMITVQYQGKTKHGIPRFPIALRIREAE